MRDARRAANAYKSPLREGQMERTREAILDALGEQLREGGLTDFSVPRVAERAGVAVRTVYRYFPTRAALLDSLNDWLNRRMGNPPLPTTADEMVAVSPKLFSRFEANASLLEARIRSGAGRELEQHSQRARAKVYERLFAEDTAHLPPDEARRVQSIFYLLNSSWAWMFFHGVWGFDAQAASEASIWAQRLLLGELRKARRGAPSSSGGAGGAGTGRAGNGNGGGAVGAAAGKTKKRRN